MSEPSPIDESAGQVVRRRRRRIVRHVREKTPDPSAKGGPTFRHSDEDENDANENSVTDETTSSSVAGNHANDRSNAVKHVSGSSHRSKILSLRDRGVGPSISFRSQSSPRAADETANASTAVSSESGGLGSLLRQVKRSMSSPR